jgi:hypothetical protein
LVHLQWTCLGIPEVSLGVVPEEVGSSGPPWRLEVSDATSPKEDTG